MRFKLNHFRILILTILTGFICVIDASAASNGHTVVIDAGHGTIVNSREYEGPTELAIAHKLKSRLEADGYKVIMTRTSNKQALGGLTRGAEYQDLRARAKIANNAGAEMVISIHSDALAVDSFHVLYPDVDVADKYGEKSTHIRNYLNIAKAMSSKVHEGMRSSGFRAWRAPHGEAYNNSNNKEGWGKPFMISAHSKAPVITVEVYGHNSKSLRDKYAQSATQDKVAQALQKGINSYFAVTPKPVAAQAAGQPAQAQPAPNEPTAADASTPKERDPDCPPEAPSAGPGEGEDYRGRIAQAFIAEFSRRTEALDAYNAPESDYGGEDIITGKGECALPIPGNSRVISGLTGKRGKAQHRGYDFSAPTGTKMVSVMAGTVVLVEDFGFRDGSGHWGNTSQNGGFGNLIRIKHDNGVYSEYHHVRTGSVGVKTGERVEKGQVIAQVDHNGWSSGAHLHFQMMNQNSSTAGYFDPGKCLGLK